MLVSFAKYDCPRCNHYQITAEDHVVYVAALVAAVGGYGTAKVGYACLASEPALRAEGAVREPPLRRARKLAIPVMPFPTGRKLEKNIGHNLPKFGRFVGIPHDPGLQRASL